jgi:CDP-glucose 4,6-dehydratase
LVRASYHAPRETFEVNAIGTAAVLDAVHSRAKPCAVVVVTSDKCYENLERAEGYCETDRLGGYDPYSASKAAAEIVVAAYRQSFFPVSRVAEHGIQVATVRAGNVIGGGDWAQDRILVDAAKCLSAGQPIPVRNPQAVRPWQHVLEPLSGYLLLAAHMLQSRDARWCSPWNFGPAPGGDLPVAQLVDLFCKAWQGGTWKDIHDPRQPHEAHLLSLNIEKSRSQLDWRPMWDASEAVRRTAEWYRRYYNRAEPSILPPSMLPVCIDDIQAYESALGEKS